MKSRYLPVLLSVWCFCLSATAGSRSDTLYTSKLSDAFQQYVRTSPEKIYLHTDKPSYFSGDTIRIKGYQVHAVSHVPEEGSRYLYVELINRKNKVVKRLKLLRNKDSYEGQIALPDDQEDGDYYLRAYTNWMRNADSDYFFSRNLHIISKPSPVHPEIRYEQSGNKRKAVVTFRKSDGSLYDHNDVHYMVRTKEYNNLFRRQKTNKQGEIFVDIPDRKELEQYLYVILEDVLQQHKYTFYIPNLFDYHVDFFPEGGPLVAGVIQKIGFKAVDTQGYPVDVTGVVVNQSGDTLTHFGSSHNGIGNFFLSTRAGERYKAVVQAEKGEDKVFDLPKPETGRHAISVINNKGLLHYDIHCPEATFPDKIFYLAGHVRGSLLFVHALKQSQGVIQIPDIPEGILTLLLLDEDYIPHSERLVFIRKNDVNGMVTPDKAVYESRSPVLLTFQLTDQEGSPLQGDFSMSVTDDSFVTIDAGEANIRSSLLLTSDLKGSIETPGFYFQDHSVRRQACLDDLMLTHGWSRFDMKSLFKKKREEPAFFMESGQIISGKVLNAVNRPQKDAQVNIFVRNRLHSSVFTDENGRFLIENLNFAGSIKVEARLQEKKQLVRSLVKIDKDSYPQAQNRNLYKPNFQSKSITSGDALQSYVFENDNWMYQLPEIEINMRMIVKQRFSSFKMDDEEMIAQKNARTALHLVKEIPGFYIIDNRPYLNPKFSMRPMMRMGDDLRNAERGRPGNDYGPTVRFRINDRFFPFNKLQQINAEDITEIYKIDPEVNVAFGLIDWKKLENDYLNALRMGASPEELEELENALLASEDIKKMLEDPNQRMDGGEIHLTLREGANLYTADDSKIDVAQLKGIDLYKQFYAPRYDRSNKGNASVADKRTTIHWQSSLTFDEQGKAQVLFYTADNPGPYTITIEGIANNGSLFHGIYSLNK